MDKISKLIIYFAWLPLYLISYAIPKKKNLWVFGSWGGYAYADNPKYLFEYVTKNYSEVKCVWLTYSKKVIKDLRHANMEVHHIYSFWGIWYCMRANVGIISHGMVDLNRYVCARQKIVETWHGIPMKPVLRSDKKIEAVNKNKSINRLKYIFPFLNKAVQFEDFFAIVGSSDYTNNILEKVFGENAPIVSTGFPRLDGMFNPDFNCGVAKNIEYLHKKGKKVGIYMPTYRREKEFDIVSYFVDNIDLIESSAERLGMVLYIKIHPFDLQKFPDNFTSGSVIFLSDSDIENDIYKVLSLFDFLITDYSSVLFDFLIVSKPVFLLTPDRDSYISSNGDFVFDYKNLNFPTYIEWKELLNSLDLSFDENGLKYFNEIGRKIHANMDGNNSKRLAEYIIKNI